MSISVSGDTIRIEGVGAVEDAEPLLLALQEGPERAVDLSGASRLHTALIQLLLASRPRLIGAPADPFQALWIAPLLAPERGTS